MIWFGPKSEKVKMQRKQKYWLKQINCAELKKIIIEFTQTVRFILLFFLSSLNFVVVHFV